MKSKDLLSQLSRLEFILDDFSFEELDASEASHLKKSFQSFKINLEEKVFGAPVAATFGGQTDYEEAPNFIKEDKEVSKAPTENMLVARVSHEIRTPLNGIIGFADLLREDTLTSKQLEQVNAIQTASYSLMEIINELLEYSKLASGQEHFERVDFNFHNVVHDVVYLCNTLITNKNIKLETSIDSTIPKILLGDPSKLSQVLLNLIGNAIKFVEKGSIHLSITQKKKKSDIYFIEFTIADTGIGISKENLAHIFDSFKQAEKDTYVKYGGTGLGLSIVRQIVKNLGGDITVSSDLGVGTTFKFLLPYLKGNDNNVTKRNENIISVEKGRELVKDMCILVFEDNILNQKLIEQRLKTWGCKTYITDSALYGLNILKNSKVDIILMDLKMPIMNGFEVTQLIRESKNKTIKQIPIIALTADFTIQDKEQCSIHGINDFILKPYSPDELLSKLVKNKKEMKTTFSVESTINPKMASNDEAALKINLSSLLEECLGEFILLEELVSLYKQNVLEFIGSTSIHLKNNDMTQLAFAAHKVKAGLSMMKSTSLHAIVEQMQKNAELDGDSKHLEFLYQCFIEEYPMVETVIDNTMEELKKSRA